MNTINLNDLRQEYLQGKLESTSTSSSPFKQFAKWFERAVAASSPLPEAATLCTTDKKGRPNARVILLKDYGENGFTFFTNYESKKGKELKKNPYVALNFFWPALEQQIRIRGKLALLPEKASDAYFKTRPRESQLASWASKQSSAVGSRRELELAFREVSTRFYNQDVPRPPNWGGYVLKPDYFEFWQGRQNRLHDRITYTLKKKNWQKSRLAP